jgi:FkbM family methyltransferase
VIDLALDQHTHPLLWKSVIGPLRLFRMLQRRLGVRDMRCGYFGAEFLVDLQAGFGFDLATRRFEHGDLVRLVNACRRLRPSVFVDIGANIGIYACIAGRLDPGIRIVAIEPDPKPFRLLQAQISHNGLGSRATLIRSAAGASPGKEVGLVHGTGVKEGWTYVTQPGDGYCTATVLTLDSLDLPRDGCVAIKIDVDGYELEVLRGGEAFFRRNHGYAQIEALGENIRAVADLMAAAGWRLAERYGINSMFEKP